ncbi:MAG: radical SAM protein [Chloroflexi bacterium HGW-Chloroflexi-2]|jgi:wyosine [tRNA(Phe)-imidazoG37] synthetase (radical SAM superfamily)|nr:MAG: radical SAM protein [Chloroflexi bacterium HGW-Chloroflexi-2]
MKYVFGPVPSRRLGQSLGIDPVILKTCNWNCVYCQLGRTIPLTNQRKEYIPTQDISSQLEQALEDHQKGGADWITFVGSGETMLASNVGILIEQIKQITKIPIAVITNGSLLYLPEVRQELLMADAVLPSLDAGNAKLYKRINRPHPQVTFNRLVNGLKLFRQEYHGKLWIEVMLMKDLNDSVETLTEIASHLRVIQPDEVHILLPTRPPVEPWVKPADQEGIQRARDIFGSIARVVNTTDGVFELAENENLVDAVVDIITRHPMKESELLETLKKYSKGNVQNTLIILEKSRKAQVVTRYGERYWSAILSHYPD